MIRGKFVRHIELGHWAAWTHFGITIAGLHWSCLSQRCWGNVLLGLRWSRGCSFHKLLNFGQWVLTRCISRVDAIRFQLWLSSFPIPYTCLLPQCRLRWLWYIPEIIASHREGATFGSLLHGYSLLMYYYLHNRSSPSQIGVQPHVSSH